MTRFRKLVSRVIIIAIFMFLFGCSSLFGIPGLPQLVPTILPPILIEAEPVACIGGDVLHHCEGGFPITNSMVATVIVDVLVIALFWAAARRPKLVPTGLQNFFEMFIEILYNQAVQVAGKNAPKVFPVGATIFIFVFFANYMELLPGIDSIGFVRHAEGNIQGYELVDESAPVVFLNPRCKVLSEKDLARLDEGERGARREAGCDDNAEGWTVVPTVRTATTDLNTTLAIALVAVASIQIYGIQGHIPHDRSGVGGVLIGMRRYFGKFFNVSGLRKEGPAKIFGAIDLFASVIEGFSELIKIVSFSFRLFGNIFAGTVLIFVVTFLVPYVGPVATLLLETFVGAIQAYVFMMLTFVFMNIAAQTHDEH